MYTNFPLLTNENTYKKEKETLDELRDKLRENYKTGGKVPNVQEDPADRKNPMMQESYKQTSEGLNDFQKALSMANNVLKPKEDMERLGFSKGGMTDTINALLTQMRTQPEKQYKQKDGEFLKDENGKLIYAGYNKEVNKEPDKFVRAMYLKLKDSGHPFPKMAAAQAGAESDYGMSALSKKANNTFGTRS